MNIRHIIREVLVTVMDEDYPSSFDMEYFKKLSSFNKRVQYAQQHLRRISSGSGRIVFEIDDNKVLKIAKNTKGLEQNTTESEWFIQEHYGDVVTKLYDSHMDDYWIEMEKAKRVGPATFKKITGIDFNVFSEYIRYKKSGLVSKDNVDAFKKLDNNPFVYRIMDMIGNYDMPYGDFLRLSSYGIVNREGKDKIVLVDFGLTQETFNTHY